MPLTFNSQKEREEFVRKMNMILMKNPDLKAILDSNTGQMETYLQNTVTYLEGKAANEDLESGTVKQGEAGKLISYVNDLLELRKAFTDIIAGTNKESVKGASKILTLIEQLSNTKNKPNFRDTLNKYYNKYSFFESNKREFRIIQGLLDSVRTMEQYILNEKRLEKVSTLSDELQALSNEKDSYETNLDSYVNLSHRAGLKPNEINTDHRIQGEKVESQNKILDDLTNEEKHKKTRDDLDPKIDEIEEQLEKKQKEIDAKVKKFEELKKFKRELDSVKVEVTSAESLIKAYNLSIDGMHEETKNIDELISRETNNKNEYDKATEEMAALLKNKTVKNDLLRYKELRSRYDNLYKANETMKLLVERNVNIQYLIALSDNGKKTDKLSKSDKENIDLYYEAKNIIVSQFFSKGSQHSAKELFEELEGPEHNMPLDFLTKTALTYSKQLMNIYQDADDIKLANKKVIDQYDAINKRISKYAKSADLIKTYEAQKLTIENNIAKVTKDKEAKTKIVSEFSEQIKKKLNLNEDDSKTIEWAKIDKRLYKDSLKLKNEIEAMAKEEGFVKLKNDHKKLVDQYNASTKDERTLKIVETTNKLNLEKEKFTIINKFKSKADSLMQSFEHIDTTRKSIHDRYQDITGTDAFSTIFERLNHISNHILDKPKDPDNIQMSEPFRNLTEKLDDVVGSIKSRDIDNNTKVQKLNQLKEFADTYLAAKKDQWRPRLFASEQRYVRISYAREISSLMDTAIELVNSSTKKDKDAIIFTESHVSKMDKEQIEDTFHKEFEKSIERQRTADTLVELKGNFFLEEKINENMKEVISPNLNI